MIEQIMEEWTDRIPKGYPTMKDGKFTDIDELYILNELLLERGYHIQSVKEWIPESLWSTLPPLPITTIDVQLNERYVEPKTISLREDRISREALAQAIDDLDVDSLSDKAVNKLYGIIQSFSTFKPLRIALQNKGFGVDKKGRFDMPKQIATTLQQMLADMPKDKYKDFIEYIQSEDQVEFPTNAGWGNMKQVLPKEIQSELEVGLGSYTGQDEKKRGVGMGEILMALAFKNIRKPAGKGDLELEGAEFEVKGAGAILGGLSFVEASKANDILRQVGIENADTKPTYDNKSYNKGALAQALAAAAKKSPEEVKSAITDLISETDIPTQDITFAANLVKNYAEASDGDINRVFGLANFIRYAKKEGFESFISMDYGAKGTNTGEYLFVKGSPEEMALELFNAKAGFEGASITRMWPRINATGGPTDSLNEAEEELDY